ncbi:MAG: DUF2802 domain-containing protein [Pseudohongiella sp.]|nr:DUF2802 domain-containing protein [Pseudohongiella sp.]MDO9519554.1 DUF2802 domain-containing protein [Pseudohongiella sp.]MDP2127438.1 DUF2802 domain-containing protein [Pseudohongiella sp.]
MSMTIVLIAVLTALAIAQLAFSMIQARHLRELAKAFAESSARQQELLASTGNALMSVHATVTALENRLTRTVQRQQDLENKDAGSLTYEQASKLIQMGAAPEDLVKTCGLSQAEARLVSLMAARGIGRAS